MFPTLHHPRLDQLSDFVAGEGDPSRADVAAHLEACARCRESLQFLRGVTEASRDIADGTPTSGLRERILSSRAAGERAILPVADATPRRRRWISPAIAAAMLAIAAGTLLVRRPDKIEAGTTSGVLRFMPAAPRPGQRVTVSYHPSALLASQPSLTLRARLRSSAGKSYNRGIPVSTIARLRLGENGDFASSFVLPDSVVYGAFAVEDSTGSVIDNNAGRSWELLVSSDSGVPLFAALDQRANDMMGRNWEEGFATAQRMVTTYPEDIRGWNWLHAFQGWLGRADDDSVRSLHRRRLTHFDSLFAAQRHVASDEEGLIAWYAEGLDSTTAAHWRGRLLHDAPDNFFAVQWRLLTVFDSLRTSHDTARAVGQLERLWAESPSSFRSQLANYGTGIAFETRDTTALKRWTDRLIRNDQDQRGVARWVAAKFAAIPSLRPEALVRLRAEVDSTLAPSASDRALDETVAGQRARQSGARRRLMAALGQALVESGRVAEGRAALADAATTGWDPELFRAIRTSSLAAGDSSRARVMAAWLAVDPRTSASFVDSVRVSAQHRLGDAGWRLELDSARAVFVQRMLTGAAARSLPGNARVRDIEGRQRTLQDLTRGRVTIVAFWSRFCGPAVEELPQLNRVAERMSHSGVPVVSIVEEAGPSSALTAFLREKKVTMPVYLDAWHEASRAFNQWGTPYFYVVDANGRVRFDVSTSADEALARAEALRLSESVARQAVQ